MSSFSLKGRIFHHPKTLGDQLWVPRLRLTIEKAHSLQESSKPIYCLKRTLWNLKKKSTCFDMTARLLKLKSWIQDLLALRSQRSCTLSVSFRHSSLLTQGGVVVTHVSRLVQKKTPGVGHCNTRNEAHIREELWCFKETPFVTISLYSKPCCHLGTFQQPPKFRLPS